MQTHYVSFWKNGQKNGKNGVSRHENGVRSIFVPFCEGVLNGAGSDPDRSAPPFAPPKPPDHSACRSVTSDVSQPTLCLSTACATSHASNAAVPPLSCPAKPTAPLHPPKANADQDHAPNNSTSDSQRDHGLCRHATDAVIATVERVVNQTVRNQSRLSSHVSSLAACPSKATEK